LPAAVVVVGMLLYAARSRMLMDPWQRLVADVSRKLVESIHPMRRISFSVLAFSAEENVVLRIWWTTFRVRESEKTNNNKRGRKEEEKKDRRKYLLVRKGSDHVYEWADKITKCERAG
jgi:hypothetical protein